MQIEDLYKIIVIMQQDFLAFRQEMSEFRKETRSKLNKHSESLIGIENTLKFYGDMYKVNKDSIQALDNRVKVAENC